MGGAAAIGPRLGQGREADVHAYGDAVIKLYRPGRGGYAAEATALTQLTGSGIAPRLIDVVEHEGRIGVVMERFDGDELLMLLQRRPWRLGRLARTLAATQLAIHRVEAPADLPDLRQRLAERVDAADLAPTLREFAVRTLDALPSGDRLCHGDYHPQNVLVAPGRVSVIDWVNAARGVPEADHARTLLLLRFTSPPGARRRRRLPVIAGRSMLARGYARAYTGGCPTPPRHVGAWLAVHAVLRLTEAHDEVERPSLLRLIDRARARG